MDTSTRSTLRRAGIGLAIAAILTVLGLAAGPHIKDWLAQRGKPAAETKEDEHDHGPANSVEISLQGLKNIGYQPHTVALGTYVRTLSLPGMVVERPGLSQIQISAPLTGVVTRILVIEGEAIEYGTPLFELRLTHEDLVSAQGEFLKLAEELDVVNREIARLESLTEGIVPGRRIVEQKYERQKLQAGLKAQWQGLLFHGLSEAQIEAIRVDRKLLQTLTVYAPLETASQTQEACASVRLLHVQKLSVQVGQLVTAGDALATLADHCQLYIKGTAFEDDAQQLREAAAAGADISGELLVGSQRQRAVTGLKLLYLSDQVEPDSRAFHFYLKLPNQVALDRRDGTHRFLQWKFQPGQRIELSIPVERWEKRLVVPAAAVISDGAEMFVYQQSGDLFVRVPVHVEHRDKQNAVIANDGAIFAGEVIAGHGAADIHRQLKNQAGGGIDPHAGHQH